MLLAHAPLPSSHHPAHPAFHNPVPKTIHERKSVFHFARITLSYQAPPPLHLVFSLHTNIPTGGEEEQDEEEEKKKKKKKEEEEKQHSKTSFLSYLCRRFAVGMMIAEDGSRWVLRTVMERLRREWEEVELYIPLSLPHYPPNPFPHFQSLMYCRLSSSPFLKAEIACLWYV